jgi:hypothetical protein
MLRTRLYLIGALLLAAFVTIPKLVKMAKIRGWVAGAHVAPFTLTQKWVDSSGGREVYWIGWTQDDIRRVGAHRLNVPTDRWSGMAIGDTVHIVTVPGDRWPYLSDGIFASTANLAFDMLLLAGELGVAWVMLNRLRSRGRPTDAAAGAT